MHYSVEPLVAGLFMLLSVSLQSRGLWPISQLLLPLGLEFNQLLGDVLKLVEPVVKPAAEVQLGPQEVSSSMLNWYREDLIYLF